MAIAIQCQQCRRIINVPEERAANPSLKVKCPCGAVFTFSSAPRVTATTSRAAPARPDARPSADRSVPAPTVAQRPGMATDTPKVPSATASRAAQGVSSAPVRTQTPTQPAPTRRASEDPGMTAATAAAAAGATPPASAAVGSPRLPPSPRRPATVNWRYCQNHQRLPSAFVCQKCMKGLCRECAQMVSSVAICPRCESLCVEVAEFSERQEMEHLRSRGMFDELKTIVTYPLADPLAFILLALFVWGFRLAAGFAFGLFYLIGIFFASGLLMAYAFNAVDRTSNGHLKGYMPEISDLIDLIVPIRMGFIAFVAASWPLILVASMSPAIMGMNLLQLTDGAPAMPVVHAQGEGIPMDEPVEPLDVGTSEYKSVTELAARRAGFLALLALAMIWKVAYSPAALTVAAVSRTAGFFSSLFQTLNPLVGLGVILRMGGIYWQALVIYTMITIVRWIAGAVFGMIPFAGSVIQTLIETYAWLMIGCTLGLAIFKRSHELGLE